MSTPRSTWSQVHGHSLHARVVGDGPPIVFLHGNPTSSYLWRDVLPLVAEHGYRCIALDLLGFGESEQPPVDLRLADHLEHVEGFLEALGTPVTLVGHDWGGVIALHLLGARPDLVNRTAFLECHIHPIDAWEDLDEGGRELFGALRTPGRGEQLALEENIFVEAVLQSGTQRTLTETDMEAYRRPLSTPATRRVTLALAREIPIAGEPADVRDLVLDNQQVIADPDRATLLMYATPGAVIGPQEVEWAAQHGQALELADLGEGIHFLPEDRPQEIAEVVVRWLASSTP